MPVVYAHNLVIDNSRNIPGSHRLHNFIERELGLSMSNPPLPKGRKLDANGRVCGVERPERHLEPLAKFCVFQLRFGEAFRVFFAHFDLVLRRVE